MLRSLALRSSLFVLLAGSVGACSASSGSDAFGGGAGGHSGGSHDGGAGDASQGDSGGTGGQGGSAGVGGGAGFGGASGAGGAGGTAGTGGAGGGNGGGGGAGGGSGAGGGTGGSGGAPCPAGSFTCNGNVQEICDGLGGYQFIDCGSNICDPLLGCVVCHPGTAACNGANSQVCLSDGSGYKDVPCDPDLGVTCDPGSGLCAGDCAPNVLGTSYIGCEYYPTVTANIVDASFHFAVAVSNTTGKPASIKITQGASTIKTATVAPNDVQVITLPWVTALKTSAADPAASVLAKQGAYRLTSNEPVTVYQFSPLEYQLGGTFSYTNDASLLLPVNAWTGTYRVAARNAWKFDAGGGHYPSFYAITANQDGTQIQLSAGAKGTVKAGIPGLPASGSGTITLNRGDVAEVFSTTGANNPEPYDLTGTLIQADKPVQVIGGVQCTFIPYNVGYCDHIEESMFPVETLSTSYIVTAPLIPTQAKPKVEMVRIIATAAGTTLTYDPPQAGAPTSIANAGDYVELASTAADFVINANQKILVAQYMEGQDVGGGSGDPAMALTVASAQYRTSYLFHAPTNYESNYVNIVAPSSATVILDGTNVTGFSPIGGSGYGVARVKLSNAGNGNHAIAAGGAPVGISVYGYGQYTSYWYPGGLNLQKL